MNTAHIWLVTTSVVALCDGVVAQDDDYCNKNYYVPLADLALSCLAKDQPCMKQFKKTIRKAIKDGCLTAQDGVYARGDGTKVDIKEYMKSHWPYGTMNLPYVKDKGFSSSTREATYGMKSVQEKPHPSGDSSKNEKTVTEAFVHQRTTHTRKDATEGSHRHGNRDGDSGSSSSSESSGPEKSGSKSSGRSRKSTDIHEEEISTAVQTARTTTVKNEEITKKNLVHSESSNFAENAGSSTSGVKASSGSHRVKHRHSKGGHKETSTAVQSEKITTVEKAERIKENRGDSESSSSSEKADPSSSRVKSSTGSNHGKRRHSKGGKKETSTAVQSEKITAVEKEERTKENRGDAESCSSSEKAGTSTSGVKSLRGSHHGKHQHSKGGKKETSTAIQSEKITAVEKEERTKENRGNAESSSSSEKAGTTTSGIKSLSGSSHHGKHRHSKEGQRETSTAVQTEKKNKEQPKTYGMPRGPSESSSSSENLDASTRGVKASNGSHRDKHQRSKGQKTRGKHRGSSKSSSCSSSSDSSDVEAGRATAGGSGRKKKQDKTTMESKSYLYNQAQASRQGSQTASQGDQGQITSAGQVQKVRSQDSQSRKKTYSEDSSSDSSSDRKRSSDGSSTSRKEKVSSKRSSKTSADYTASTRSEDAAVNGETSTVVKSKSQSKKKKSKESQSSKIFSNQHDSGEEGRGTQDDPGLTTIDHETASSNTRTKIRLGGEGSTNIQL